MRQLQVKRLRIRHALPVKRAALIAALAFPEGRT